MGDDFSVLNAPQSPNPFRRDVSTYFYVCFVDREVNCRTSIGMFGLSS